MHSTTGRGRDFQSLDCDVLVNKESAPTRSAINVPQVCWLIRTEFSVCTGGCVDSRAILLMTKRFSVTRPRHGSRLVRASFAGRLISLQSQTEELAPNRKKSSYSNVGRQRFGERHRQEQRAGDIVARIGHLALQASGWSATGARSEDFLAVLPRRASRERHRRIAFHRTDHQRRGKHNIAADATLAPERKKSR